MILIIMFSVILLLLVNFRTTSIFEYKEDLSKAIYYANTEMIEYNIHMFSFWKIDRDKIDYDFNYYLYRPWINLRERLKEMEDGMKIIVEDFKEKNRPLGYKE